MYLAVHSGAPEGRGVLDETTHVTRVIARLTLAARIVCAAFLVALLVAAFAPGRAEAVPVQGHTGWSVLLCKFSGDASEPQTPQFFAEFLTGTGRGMGGVADYFADQSGGRLTLNGSVVKGWYTMPFTLAQEQPKTRWQKTQDCVDTAARGGYSVPAGHRITVIINGVVDSGSAGGRVLLDPKAWNVGFAAHEMLHGYGLDHSYSDDTSYKNVTWSQPGEYDDSWDHMSAMNHFSFNTARFGASAVGLNGYFRDKIGWLPRSRVFTFGANGVGSRTMTLAPLEVPSAFGPQLVRVPFDAGDPFRYYTVEFRKKTGWSAGIPGDVVLIHEVRNGTPYLLRTRGGSRAPVQALSANGVTIKVNGASGNAASVTITSAITEHCVPGFVWREARAGDRACVTPATRGQVRGDNAAASRRWVNGAHGRHSCISGYVWREAVRGDDVCVTPSRRDQARADNAKAASRRNPARFVQGPNTCKNGFVWRDADGTDSVCVTPATRRQVRADNAAASRRWVKGAYGPHSCISGYVWREAFAGDEVCVTPSQRNQARADNTAAPSRTARP
jgi:hypothetical protein